MPYHATFTDENYEFLLAFLQSRFRMDTGMRVSLSNSIKALQDAKADNVKPAKIALPEVQEIKTPVVATKFKPCKEHPLYGAKRSPRSDCKGCWDAYGQVHPDRVKAVKKAAGV